MYFRISYPGCFFFQVSSMAYDLAPCCQFNQFWCLLDCWSNLFMVADELRNYGERLQSPSTWVISFCFLGEFDEFTDITSTQEWYLLTEFWNGTPKVCKLISRWFFHGIICYMIRNCEVHFKPKRHSWKE